MAETISVTGHGQTLDAAKMNAAKMVEQATGSDKVYVFNDCPHVFGWRPTNISASVIHTHSGEVILVRVDVDFEHIVGKTI